MQRLVEVDSSLRREHVTPTELQEAVSDIDEETSRLNRIVSEVLDFARPIRFDFAEPGGETFLGCASARVVELSLNGEPVDPDAHDGSRIWLRDLAGNNTLRVVTEGEYSKSGKGVNRFLDPADDNVYVHTDSEPFDAHRVYPCFDQPDIKGRFRFSALVPRGWEAISNARPTGPPDETDDGLRWTFEVTPPISTSRGRLTD